MKRADLERYLAATAAFWRAKAAITQFGTILPTAKWRRFLATVKSKKALFAPFAVNWKFRGHSSCNRAFPRV